MNTSPRDDRENVEGLRDDMEVTFHGTSTGIVAMSNNGWWVDENDNVWAPNEKPTLVLANGDPFGQIVWHASNENPVLEMNRKCEIIRLGKKDQWIGDLLNGD